MPKTEEKGSGSILTEADFQEFYRLIAFAAQRSFQRSSLCQLIDKQLRRYILNPHSLSETRLSTLLLQLDNVKNILEDKAFSAEFFGQLPEADALKEKQKLQHIATLFKKEDKQIPLLVLPEDQRHELIDNLDRIKKKCESPILFKPIEHMKTGTSIEERKHSHSQPSQAIKLNNEGNEFLENEEYKKAFDSYAQAIAAHTPSEDISHLKLYQRNLLQALHLLNNSLMLYSGFDKAIDMLNSTVEILETIPPESQDVSAKQYLTFSRRNLASILSYKAGAYHLIGDYESAFKLYQMCAEELDHYCKKYKDDEIAQQELYGYQRSMAASLNHLAEKAAIEESVGSNQEVINFLKQSIDIMHAIPEKFKVEADQLYLAEVKNDLASRFSSNKEFKEAENYYIESINHYEQFVKESGEGGLESIAESYAETLKRYAEILLHKIGKIDEAVLFFRKALSVHMLVPGSDDFNLHRRLHRRALASALELQAQHQADHLKAVECYKESIAIFGELNLGTTHEITVLEAQIALRLADHAASSAFPLNDQYKKEALEIFSKSIPELESYPDQYKDDKQRKLLLDAKNMFHRLSQPTLSSGAVFASPSTLTPASSDLAAPSEKSTLKKT